MFFYTFLPFSVIHWMLVTWFLVPLPFLPDLNTWKFLVHAILKPRLEDFEYNLSSMGNELSCPVVWTFFSTVLLGNWDEDWTFPVLWPLLGFPNLPAYWGQHFTASFFFFFKILNSFVGIPSLPLSFLAAVLPKTHLTSDSRMSGSEWEPTPSWLSRTLKPLCTVLLCMKLPSP